METSLAGARLQPLGHLSTDGSKGFGGVKQPLFYVFLRELSKNVGTFLVHRIHVVFRDYLVSMRIKFRE